MPQRASHVNGNPLEAAVESIEREFERLRKQLRSQSRSLEKRIDKGRRQLETRRHRLETRGRKQLKSLLAEVRRNPVVKRARALRKDAEKQIETRVDEVLSLLQIASKSDVQKIDRQIRTLNKKLAGLEKAKKARRAEQRPAASA